MEDDPLNVWRNHPAIVPNDHLAEERTVFICDPVASCRICGKQLLPDERKQYIEPFVPMNNRCPDHGYPFEWGRYE